MSEHLKYFRWTTYVQIGCGLVWLVSFIDSPTLAEAAATLAIFGLAGYDYMLNRVMVMVDELLDEVFP